MEIIIGIVGLIIGASIAFVILNKKNSSKANSVLSDAKKEAEQIKKEKLLQAKEKFIELKSEHEKVINKKNNEINNIHQKAKQKESALNQREYTKSEVI
jgi:ribonuclease Y